MQRVDLYTAQLQGADLSYAQMQGATFAGSMAWGADLEGAQLQRANLARATLSGANLTDAELSGANLESAWLRGANLAGALLLGANLNGAQLQGANLRGAQLQGADLPAVQLQEGDLGTAQLEGADLFGAQLRGTRLMGAQLQGATLYNADLADSDLGEAFVFRTDIGGVDLSTAVIPSIHANQVKLNESGEIERLGQPDINAWIEGVSKFATEEATKDRFARLKLDPGFQTPAEDVADVTMWTELTKESRASDLDGYSKRLGEALAKLICDDQGAPDVARGLIRYGRLAALGDQLSLIRTRIKEGRGDPDTCLGVAGFTEDDWRALDAIKPTETAPADH